MRCDALRLVAEMLTENPNTIDFAQDQEALRETLLAFPGVGRWTSAYVAMRVLGAPDVMLPNDVAVLAGARALGLSEAPEDIAKHFQPWRSYFTLHLWNAATEYAATLKPDSRQRAIATVPML